MKKRSVKKTSVFPAGIEPEAKEKEELDRELQKGFDDIDAGRVKSADEIFDELNKKYLTI